MLERTGMTSCVAQLREKKERRKEKKRKAKRRKRNETVRETSEERIARREARMSNEVNRHTQANKIWIKMRRMRSARLRMVDNARHYVDEVHEKSAAFINRNFDMFISPFETQSIMKKERSEGKKRKLNANWHEACVHRPTIDLGPIY